MLKIVFSNDTSIKDFANEIYNIADVYCGDITLERAKATKRRGYTHSLPHVNKQG